MEVDLPGVRLVNDTRSGQPETVGVIVDLPGVRGEGWLTRDGSRWRGTVEVDLGLASVTGLAILDDGQAGAPAGMVVLLATDFTPPIQLSFGFALLADNRCRRWVLGR